MNNEHGVILGGIGVGFQGFYRAMAINEKKEITADSGWHHNLIFNVGMDAVASVGILNLFGAGVAGTGSRPNSITSSTSTITQSANTVYLYERTGLPDFTSSYSTYTSSVNVGDVLVYGNFSQSMVTAITDGFNLQVNTSYTIDVADSQSFTIWKTSQARLEKEIRRSNGYLVGSSSILGFNCGTVDSGSTKMSRRTFEFAAETTQKDYSEVGCSWSNTARSDVFSRAVLPQTVSVPAGSQLRMIYELVVSFTPNVPRYITPSITGWTNTSGTESIQNYSMPDVNVNGGSNYGTILTDFGVLDPAAYHGYDLYYCVGSISDVATPLSSDVTSRTDRTLNGTVTTGLGVQAGVSVYVAGDYFKYKYTTFGTQVGNSSNIRSIAMGASYTANYPASNHQGHVIVFDVPHEKTNLQIAAATYRFSWTRVLR